MREERRERWGERERERKMEGERERRERWREREREKIEQNQFLKVIKELYKNEPHNN